MLARAKKYIDAIISYQKPDGWICPCADEERKTYDTWAVQLITKTLTVYYQCSKDGRIPDVIYRVLKNYYEMLKSGEITLFDWGKARWFECFIAINFIYERKHEEWLVELAKILKEQGMDYSEATPLWERPLNSWRFDTHIVNLGMILKSEAVSCGILGEKYSGKAEKLHEILKKYNGTPVGLFTGEKKWAGRLELLAFNALPATLSDDMWAHQYVQMSNQIACEKFPGKSLFRTNGPEAHLFGLEPNFGCCTANFNQAWPKFALSAFMHSGDTVINAIPVPSELNADGKHIRIDTDYPFRNNFEYRIEAEKAFIFKIRIPSFAKNLTVNGESVNADELCFNISAGEKLTLYINFETEPYFEKRPHSLNAVKCGSLVFSVPIEYGQIRHEYEKDGVERKFPYCDYEYIPQSDWNFAFCSDELEVRQSNALKDMPFASHCPPVTVKAYVQKINWGLEDGYESVCAKVPESRKAIGEKEEILLYPYGCAKLRMTELPFAE